MNHLKNLILALALLFISNVGLTQIINEDQPPKLAKLKIVNEAKFIRFTVEDVKPDSKLPKMIPYDTAVLWRFKDYEEVMNDSQREQLLSGVIKKDDLKKPEKITPLCVSSKPQTLSYSGTHPMIAALAYAYAHHTNITISPDMVWLMLMQGLGIHVNMNAEKLRTKIVDFDGKKNLDVEVSPVFNMKSIKDWENVVTEFKSQIKANVGENLGKIIRGKFSTTTPNEELAQSIALMYLTSPYFTYSLSIVCGIPEIKLEGTVEDWKKVRLLATELKQFDLDWWIDELLPILDEFVKSRSGDVNQEFWSKIFQIKKKDVVCGYVSYLNGWMVNFFPYINAKGKFVRNPVLDGTSRDLKFGEIPLGLSKATVLVAGQEKTPYQNCYLMAGFVGMNYDSVTNHLKPEISWGVLESDTPPSKENIKNYQESRAKKAQ